MKYSVEVKNKRKDEPCFYFVAYAGRGEERKRFRVYLGREMPSLPKDIRLKEKIMDEKIRAYEELLQKAK